MKNLIIMFVVAMGFQSVHAGTMQLNCETSLDETVKIYISTDKSQNPAYMEIYSQGGLGPNFLDSSYTASKTDLVISPDDQITLNARFGKIVEVNLNYDAQKAGEGSMKFNGTKAIELKNCTHNF